MIDYKCPHCEHEIDHNRVDSPDGLMDGIFLFTTNNFVRKCGRCKNKFRVITTIKTSYEIIKLK